jgi:hypothetical protein
MGLCSVLPPPSPGSTRGGRGGGGLELLNTGRFSPTLSPPTPGPARGRRGGGGLLDRDYFSSELSPPSTGPAHGRRGGVGGRTWPPLPPPPEVRRTAGPGLLFCAILAAVPGPGPGMAGGGEDCWTWTAPRPPRAWGASPLRARLPPLHTFTHHFIPPSPSLCTFIIIPPAAIVKPQGFLARGFPPRRAAGVHSHLTLSHASHHPTNLSDSPPAGMDTCCLSPLEQETPSEPPRWSVLPSPPPAASPRCWVRLDVSSDVRVGVPPRCCRRGGRGLSDCTTTPPPHSIPPHINPPHTPYHTHALHTPLYSRTLAPSREAKLSSTVVSSLPHLIL